MSKQFPILDRIKEANPLYGPGNAPMCERCTEHLKHEVDHIIVEELETLCIPTETINGRNPWEHIIDLLRVRRGQR